MSYNELSSDDISEDVRFARYEYKMLASFLVRLHELCLRLTPDACGNILPVEALWTLQGELVLDLHSFGSRFCRFQNCGDDDCGSLVSRHHLESSLEDIARGPHIEKKSICRCKFVPGDVLVFHDEGRYDAFGLESLSHWYYKHFNKSESTHWGSRAAVARLKAQGVNSTAFLYFVFVVYINLKTYTCRWRIANFFLSPKVGTRCLHYSEDNPENRLKHSCEGVVRAALEQWVLHANPNRILMIDLSGGLVDISEVSSLCRRLVQLCDGEVRTGIALAVTFWPFDKYKGLPAFVYNALVTLLCNVQVAMDLIAIDLNYLVKTGPRCAPKYRHYIWDAIRGPYRVDPKEYPPFSPQWLRTSEDGYDTTYNYRESVDSLLSSQCDAELHLELMTWQLVPAMDPRKITSLRIGVCGLGTLGTSIIRQLLAWGVSSFNIVDNAKVTNASRQSLYTFSDLNTYKTEAAYKAITAIRPDAHVKKYIFTIPMPGHRMDKNSANRGLDLLNKVMDESDVLFLTTDSKESRWLPTLIAASRNLKLESSPEDGHVHVPLVISARLSFDSWMVVRHSYKSFSAACFFCSETDALGGAAIPGRVDEHCTLVKPGTCGICSSVAVELLMALVQHDQGFEAPHDSKSILGPTPHCIKMQSGDFGIKFFYGEPSAQCMGCGKQLAELLEKDATSLVNKALEDPQWLLEASGMSKVVNSQLLDDNTVEHITKEPMARGDC